MKPVYTRRPRQNRPRGLLIDSILEAIRRGASRLHCPSGVTGWAVVARRLGMHHDRYTGCWEPTPETMRAVMDYLGRRKRGASPLAINDVYPIQRMTENT